MKKIIYALAVSLLLLVIPGCSDFFNPETENMLPEDNYMDAKVELYTGYMGLAAGVQAVVDQAIFLEGLRTDLLEPTEHASAEIWDVYNYKDDLSDNSFASPVGFYNIIINANDYLKHVYEYKAKNPTALSSSAYSGIIGGAIRFKAWAYLMLAKIYGEAVYLEMGDSFADNEDINKYPKLDFDGIIDKCIQLIEVGEGGTTGMGSIRWSTELFPGQPDSPERLEWNRICPPAECLLAELYLFKVKDVKDPDASDGALNEINLSYYRKVWDNCRKIISEGGETEDSFTLNRSKYNGSWKQLFSGTSYDRQNHIAVAFYDYNRKQTNRLVDYFSDLEPNHYYLRPTEAAIERWTSINVSTDASIQNYRGQGASYKAASTSGDWIFCKYTRGHETADVVYRNDVFIPYYRAADIHLWLAEACAGLGLSKDEEANPNVNRHFEAWTFLNGGISPYFNVSANAFKAPFTEYSWSLYLAPGKTNQMSCQGVRGRVEALPVGEFLFDQTATTNKPRLPEYSQFEATFTLDSLLVEETFLESAGEARSYYAMLRMNRKYGTRSQEHWAEVVSRKYPDGGASIRGKLSSDISNWFIKYDLKLKD